MLVLTRKQTETIHIGEDIVVKVIQTGRGSIKLGIEAPPHVRVMRGEVAEVCDLEKSHTCISPDRPLFVLASRTSDPSCVGAV